MNLHVHCHVVLALMPDACLYHVLCEHSCNIFDTECSVSDCLLFQTVHVFFSSRSAMCMLLLLTSCLQQVWGASSTAVPQNLW